MNERTEIGYIDNCDDEITESRLKEVINFEGSYREVEKLALETMARTGRPVLFCFELAMSMQRIRNLVNEGRRDRGKPI